MTYKEKSIGIGEAYSLIVQATTGCSYNKCTFCSKYDKEFKVRDFKDIVEDLAIAREHYTNINKIFISDGDALSMETEDILKILKSIELLFPENKEIYIYASAISVLDKTIEELEELKNAGLSTIYMGVETGSDMILYEIEKGVNKEELVLAGRKIKHCNIKLHTRVIAGIGGIKHSVEHSKETARILNRIRPDMISIEDMDLSKNSPMYEKVEKGGMKLLTLRETLTEIRNMIGYMKFEEDTVIESKNVSDGNVIHGVLPRDKERILNNIDESIDEIGYMGGKNNRI